MRKYTKEDLEELVYVQLDNLNIQGDYIRLLREQNELLVQFNHQLMEEISQTNKQVKPYPVQGRRGKAKEK